MDGIRTSKTWWSEPPERASEQELLAELIGGKDAGRLASLVLERAGCLRSLASAGTGELSPLRVPSRRRLVAAFELGRRWSQVPMRPGRSYRCARDVHQHLWPMLADRGQETLLVLLLDGRNRFQRMVEVSRGTLTASLAHPREVFATAIRERAGALVLVHNHPSGDPSPSPEDDAITERMCAVGELVGIRVLDHVILGEQGYLSYLESGRLPDATRQKQASIATDGRP